MHYGPAIDESGVDKGEGYAVDGIPPGAAGVYRLNRDITDVAALGDVVGIQRGVLPGGPAQFDRAIAQGAAPAIRLMA